MLQSKKVKLVATKSGPFSTLTESLLVKWDSPLGMIGSRSFLRQRWHDETLFEKMLLGQRWHEALSEGTLPGGKEVDRLGILRSKQY